MRKMRYLSISLLFTVTVYISFPLYSYSSFEDNGQKSNMAKMFFDAASRVFMEQGIPGTKPKHSLLHELKLIFSDLRHSVLLGYLKDAGDVKCVEDLMFIFQNLYSTTDDWAFRMIDSYGKPESGLLRGKLKWPGDYDECIDTYAAYDETYKQGGFRGQYCSITVGITFAEQNLPVRLGICLPDSCHSYALKLEDLVKMNKQISPNMKHSFHDINLTCQPTSRALTTEAIIVWCIIYSIVLLTVIGSTITAFDYFVKTPIKSHGSDSDIEKEPIKEDHEKLILKDDERDFTTVKIGYRETEMQSWEMTKSFFNTFCIFSNCTNLMDSKSSENHLRCLHGIRFLSLCWLLFCNTYTLGMNVIKNVSDVLENLDSWSSQIVLNGIFSSDSFFLLSGFLVGNVFFKKSSKTKDKIKWIYIYIHRYLRLTPVYIFILMFYATMYSYLGSGPNWVNYDTDPTCSKSWWWNVLYINNFQRTTEQCVRGSWYFASDFQFFMISPLLLVPLLRRPKMGYIILAALLFVTFVSNIVVTQYLSLTAGFDKISSFDDWQEYFSRLTDTLDYIHKKPYTSISPYLVGIMLAYYLHIRKVRGCDKNGWITLALGWTLSAVVSSLCVFGPYTHKLSLLESSFYHAFSHTAFAISLAWVIFVCVTGQGGFINSFLSWKIFIPLSRLTFCVYLVHPIILTAFYGSQKSLIHFSNITMIVLFLGFLILSYTVALLTSLLLEAPVIRFEKYFRSNYKSSHY